jgi:hypothetical protein
VLIIRPKALESLCGLQEFRNRCSATGGVMQKNAFDLHYAYRLLTPVGK